MRDARSANLVRCHEAGGCGQAAAQFVLAYENKLLFLAAAFYLVPVVIGMFWGAPLVAAELEQGTHRMVWNQGVTRTRWLATKLLFGGLASMVVAGVMSLLLTWAAHPVDDVADNRFSAIAFGARGIVPVAYAALAFVMGATLGVLMRRRLPAMALVAVLFIALQFAVPNFVRPHLMPPESTSREMTATAINEARSLGSITGSSTLGGLRIPGAWVSHTSPLLTARGEPLPADQFNRCFLHPARTGATGTFGDTAVCLAKLRLHVQMQYHPNTRFWPFQLIESGLFICATILVALICARRVRHLG
jgi:hypothetical protein